MSKCFEDLKSEQDMISSLPDEITDMILVRLSLDEIINTSYLSRHWRYKWRFISEITFPWFRFIEAETIATKRADQILSLHRGNIQKFVCYGNHVIHGNMDMWLSHLARDNCIQQLELVFSRQGTKYLLPSSIFSFQNLINLKLKRVKIILPSSFVGFQRLTTLTIHCIKFDDGGYKKLEELIHFCPLLKHLNVVLSFKDNSTLLELNTPNLQSLKFKGPLKSLSFKDTPLINNARLIHSGRYSLSYYNLANIFGGLSNVVHLQFDRCLSPFKSIAYESSSLRAIKFNFLKKLELNVDLSCPRQCAILCCILKNSPALVYLAINSILSCDDDSYAAKLQEFIDLCPLLDHLKLDIFFQSNTISVFELNAPNLHSLEFHGPFAYLQIKDAPAITTASLSRHFCHWSIDFRNLTILLGGFSNVSCLRLLGYPSPFKDTISESSLDSLQKIKFNFLKNLEIVMDMNSSGDIAVLCCILKNSPLLVCLNISQPSDTKERFVDTSNLNCIPFRHLKIFKMDIIFGSKSEMGFIKLVLGNAPLLQICRLKQIRNLYEYKPKELNILSELLSFEQASSAKVYFESWSKYKQQ